MSIEEKKKDIKKKDFKNGKLIYHLTALENLPSILKDGLKSRSSMNGNGFKDVGDSSILESRKSKKLESYVPFHFFSKTPFDYAVQKNNKKIKFVLIAVLRSTAKTNSWKVIPKHPLSKVAATGMAVNKNATTLNVMDYDKGIEAVDWELMESTKHQYDNHTDYKQTCMAECLSPSTVTSNNLHSIFVETEEDKKKVGKIMEDAKLKNIHINLNSNMFVS